MLEGLCAMISEYNREQKLSVLGFGAKLPASEKTSHCFPLCQESVYCHGIKVSQNFVWLSFHTLVVVGACGGDANGCQQRTTCILQAFWPPRKPKIESCITSFL